jgi:hypothetical protein
MSVLALTTTKSTIYTGGKTETVIITNDSTSSDVMNVYVNGETAATVSIPKGATQPIRRVAGITLLEAKVVTGTGTGTLSLSVQ